MVRIRKSLAGMALLVGCMAAYAANEVSVAIDDCSGTRQTTVSSASQILDCSGNFTLSNGIITSDVALVISGKDALSLMNVRIVAPSVYLRSDGAIAVGNGVELITDEAKIESTSASSAPPVTSIGNGATISIGGAPAEQLGVSAGTLVGLAASGSGQLSPNAGQVTVTSGQKSGGGAIGPADVLALLGLAAAGRWLRSRRACHRSV